MEKNNKNLLIVGIVAIVAIIGVVLMTTSMQIGTVATETSTDTAGKATQPYNRIGIVSGDIFISNVRLNGHDAGDSTAILTQGDMLYITTYVTNVGQTLLKPEDGVNVIVHVTRPDGENDSMEMNYDYNANLFYIKEGPLDTNALTGTWSYYITATQGDSKAQAGPYRFIIEKTTKLQITKISLDDTDPESIQTYRVGDRFILRATVVNADGTPQSPNDHISVIAHFGVNDMAYDVEIQEYNYDRNAFEFKSGELSTNDPSGEWTVYVTATDGVSTVRSGKTLKFITEVYSDIHFSDIKIEDRSYMPGDDIYAEAKIIDNNGVNVPPDAITVKGYFITPNNTIYRVEDANYNYYDQTYKSYINNLPLDIPRGQWSVYFVASRGPEITKSYEEWFYVEDTKIESSGQLIKTFNMRDKESTIEAKSHGWIQSIDTEAIQASTSCYVENDWFQGKLYDIYPKIIDNNDRAHFSVEAIGNNVYKEGESMQCSAYAWKWNTNINVYDDSTINKEKYVFPSIDKVRFLPAFDDEDRQIKDTYQLKIGVSNPQNGINHVYYDIYYFDDASNFQNLVYGYYTYNESEMKNAPTKYNILVNTSGISVGEYLTIVVTVRTGDLISQTYVSREFGVMGNVVIEDGKEVREVKEVATPPVKLMAEIMKEYSTAAETTNTDAKNFQKIEQRLESTTNNATKAEGMDFLQ